MLRAVLSGSCCLLAILEMLRVRYQVRKLQAECARAHQLRLEERAGRTAAERKMRQQLKPTPSGELTQLSYTAIGTISSCFVERRGTPRQGMLAPAARAWLQLDVRVVQPAALEGLEQFSHVWLLYDFHENTNAAKLSSSAGGSAGQLRAKVHPPGLGGERIGLFATRTPHRPSPIGLTVAQLLEVRGDTLILGGADIVDGTPVLDIKPYLRHDIQADAKVPQWCERKTDASSVVSVGFTPEAEMALEAAVPHLRFFSDLTNAREAVVQMLQLDIRSVHQGRGKQTTSKEGQEYYCRIDVLELTFSTFDSQVLVTRICVKR